jgi:hypothetical protein
MWQWHTLVDISLWGINYKMYIANSPLTSSFSVKKKKKKKISAGDKDKRK